MVNMFSGGDSMKKISFCVLIIIIVGLLSGCVIRDNEDDYEREQFQSMDEVSIIIVEDISTDVIIKKTTNKEINVEYSDSPNNPWYSVDISNEILTIKKTRETIGIKKNSLIISLPQKEYQKLFVKTTNGSIIFDSITSLLYKCSTENGDIKGCLNGLKSEYLIVASVENGNCNLKNNVIESSKIIEFIISNGNINIEFTNS